MQADPSRTPDPAEQELFWSELMDQLAGRNVVPIVGPDLLQVEVNGVTTPLTTEIARRTLSRLGLASGDAGPATVNDAVVAYLARRGGANLQPLYAAVHAVVSDPAFPVPQLLRTLAGIDAFKLFVTTMPAPLLRRAVDHSRAPAVALPLSYSLRQRPDDLPAPLDEIQQPVVYHLLGRTAVTESYALTEEDTLEFLHSLQSSANRPEQLFQELRTRSLLVIGSGYTDWLTRFFLRLVRGERLRQSGPSGYLAEVAAGSDQAFVRFLRYFSGHTQIFPGDPRAFVSELAERWQQHAAQQAPPTGGAGPAAAFTPPEPKSIFLSYASEDRDEAQRLHDALRAAGLPVWFDKNVLRSGDVFDQAIRDAIRRCSLFVLILSRRVLTYEGRFFFREWNAAISVATYYGEGRRFILPCRIDDVPLNAAEIPAAIRELDVDDVVDPPSRDRFVQLVVELFRTYQLAQRPA